MKQNYKLEIAKLKKKLRDLNWASKKTNEGIRLLYKELEKKNEKLKQLDQLKSQFVTNVAHELKNPLSAVKEAMQIVIDGCTGDIEPRGKEILEIGQRTTNRLSRLVENILDLSKIESGHTHLEISTVDINELVTEVISTYKADLAKKNIVIRKEIPDKIGPVKADRDRLIEVIINLLINAIKYTPAGGSVTVRVSKDTSCVRFEVSDTGPGIPKECYTKIFDKFERITAEKAEGTGLGLAIAKEIVEMHKGKIWVESILGRGSSFIFTLPKE